jgi:hypothetical protein
MATTVGAWAALLLLPAAPLAVSQLPPTPPAAMVEKLGAGLFRLGEVRVNTDSKEVSVRGIVNAVRVLEFVANTKDGFKAYESALTLETNAATFNAALLLIGLDRRHARAPTRHFDPATPLGDPVEVWVEWMQGAEQRRVPAEELLFDKRTNETLTVGTWVYTGSTFLPDGRYSADLDGVVIGFVHSPAPIIENPRGLGVGRYGDIVLNEKLGLAPGTAVTLTVRATATSPGQ